MKEQRGPFGKIADSVSGSLRRRQQDREPRAVAFDAGGHPSVIAPGTPEHTALIETAERMVRLAFGGSRPPDDDGGEPGPEGGAPG